MMCTIRQKTMQQYLWVKMYFAFYTEYASIAKHKMTMNKGLFHKKITPLYIFLDQHLQFYMLLVHPYPWEVLINRRLNPRGKRLNIHNHSYK